MINIEACLDVRMKAEATALTLWGKTSPSNAKGTGPIPNPYDKPESITQMGNTTLQMLKMYSSSAVVWRENDES